MIAPDYSDLIFIITLKVSDFIFTFSIYFFNIHLLKSSSVHLCYMLGIQGWASPGFLTLGIFPFGVGDESEAQDVKW